MSIGAAPLMPGYDLAETMATLLDQLVDNQERGGLRTTPNRVSR